MFSREDNTFKDARPTTSSFKRSSNKHKSLGGRERDKVPEESRNLVKIERRTINPTDMGRDEAYGGTRKAK